MADVPIAPLNPNLSNQAMGVAGSEAVIFTATDRKIIEDRTGAENDRTRSFLDVLFKKQDRPISPKVENEETIIRKGTELAQSGKYHRDDFNILEQVATPLIPKERVEIKAEINDKYGEPKHDRNPSTDVLEIKNEDEISESEKEEAKEKTITLAKELKFDPHELLKTFALEEKELLSLLTLIEDLYLKRLLSESKVEFDRFTELIKMATLPRAKPEAKVWWENMLDKLTIDSAKYKLNLAQSLESIHFNAHLERTIRWLKKTIERLSSKT